MSSAANNLSITRGRTGGRWWILAATSALLITTLVAAVIYLVTKKPATVDQVIILTNPSGAEIMLDAKSYGTTPVKIEQLKAGTYTLTITKDQYETYTEKIEISDAQPTIERKLKLEVSADMANLPPEEKIRRLQEQAEAAFARGSYLIPFEGSAFWYSQQIIDEDANNEFARAMQERIRKQRLQDSQVEYARGDFSSAMRILGSLNEYYPNDSEIRTAMARMEAQLSTKRGEVQGLVAKADAALRAGNLLDPVRANADFFARQVLAIDPQNAQARSIRQQVKDRSIEAVEQAQVRGDLEGAIRLLARVELAFADDKQVRQLKAQLVDASSRKAAEVARTNDAEYRRQEGLSKNRSGDFAGAISDLNFALINGKGSADVIFALAYSHYKLGHYTQAGEYFRQVPSSAGEQYISSIALLGEIASKQGDTDTALRRYKEARQLGGSSLFLIATLDDRIEKIENRIREKEEAPSPVGIPVKHEHGAFRGSCSGTLTVNGAGVNYNGEDAFAATLTGVSAGFSKKGLTISWAGKSITFKTTASYANQFLEALGKYQKASK
ncbi:MAG: PEGA domain-containing protein [Acidobacteriota bacterium]